MIYKNYQSMEAYEMDKLFFRFWGSERARFKTTIIVLMIVTTIVAIVLSFVGNNAGVVCFCFVFTIALGLILWAGLKWGLAGEKDKDKRY